MKLVIFGLTISSSWGNGHATLWRGLCRALNGDGHEVVFFERDVPYYAGTRDYWDIPGGRLVLYREWSEAEARARQEIADADAAVVTSYCPDAVAAEDLILDAPVLHVFYDLDTPITLGKLRRGEDVPYLGSSGLANYDLVLSFTGGAALDLLRDCLGARCVAPLYGHVDPGQHKRVASVETYRSGLSYLGTYAGDRQGALEELFVQPARSLPDMRFVIGGAQYPPEFPWAENIYFVRHLPPGEHPAFFSSSRLTLNVTRRDMADMGWCPSGRLFEAAACGTPIVSDWWEGLETFFDPGREIVIAQSSQDVVAALNCSDAELSRVAAGARARVFDQHTSMHRAREFVRLLEEVPSRQAGSDIADSARA